MLLEFISESDKLWHEMLTSIIDHWRYNWLSLTRILFNLLCFLSWTFWKWLTAWKYKGQCKIIIDLCTCVQRTLPRVVSRIFTFRRRFIFLFFIRQRFIHQKIRNHWKIMLLFIVSDNVLIVNYEDNHLHDNLLIPLGRLSLESLSSSSSSAAPISSSAIAWLESE